MNPVPTSFEKEKQEMIRKLFICILFLVIGALAQANFELSPTLASRSDVSSPQTLKSTVADLLLAQAGLQAGQTSLQTGQTALQTGQTALEQGALQYMTVVTGAINGMPGPHIIITGANLHIRSGEGVTNGADTGVGNVVVGYNEEPGGGLSAGDREGTHNLIVGPQHKYLSFGGFLAGLTNTASGFYASVRGGSNNTASGAAASVSGGNGNTASSFHASVSGGRNNTASGQTASVSGGASRTASGPDDWAAGGLFEGS